MLLLLQTETGSIPGFGEALAKFSRNYAELYWDFNETIARPLGGQEVPRNGGYFTQLYIYIYYNFFGRPIENRRLMFLSPLVGWLVSLSHEVEKMSNKIVLIKNVTFFIRTVFFIRTQTHTKLFFYKNIFFNI